MTGYSIGQRLPTLAFDVMSTAVIVGNIATLDFFPALIEAEYAQSVGHETVFMNTMSQLALLDRYVLDHLGPDARIRAHEISMRRPVYAGLTVELNGTITSISSHPGSSLAPAGVALEISATISAADEPRTVAALTVVVPATGDTRTP